MFTLIKYFRLILKSLFILCWLLFLSEFNIIAQTENDSLAEYLHQAALNNPQIQSTYNDYLASLEKLPQVGSLPDPQLSIGYFLKPMELIGGNQRADIRLMQMFPWFGTLKAAKDEASQMANVKYEQFRQINLKIFYQVKKEWYGLYRINKEIALAENNLRLLHSLEQMALIRFKTVSAGNPVNSGTSMNQTTNSSSSQNGTSMGSGMNSSGNINPTNSPTQVMESGQAEMAGASGNGDLTNLLRVQMQIRELDNKLALLKDQKTIQIAQFNSLLNRSQNLPVFIADTLEAGTLPVELALIADSILKNNPMIRMFDAEQASYEAEKQMVQKMGYPMLGIGIDYALINKRSENDAMMNGKDMIMPMATITLPIYRKKYKSMVKEAELKRLASYEANLNVKNNLTVNYDETLVSFNDAERRINLYKGQVDLAQKTVDLLITAFSVEGKDYEEVLRMQQQLLDYEFKLIDAVVDQNIAVAMFENLMAFTK